MKFIVLHHFQNNNDILVNVANIDCFFKIAENQTKVKLSNTELVVKEDINEILNKMANWA